SCLRVTMIRNFIRVPLVTLDPRSPGSLTRSQARGGVAPRRANTAFRVWVDGRRIRRVLVQGGRKYRLCAVAADGSALYRSAGRGSVDHWLRSADGEEQSWSYLTSFGRARALPPPGGGDWKPTGQAIRERHSAARSQLLSKGLPIDR